VASSGTRTPRPFWLHWRYRFGFTVIVFGYGIALGPNRTKGDGNVWQRDWWPVTVFRNRYVRGPFRG
jgi:hypothetical protein